MNTLNCHINCGNQFRTKFGDNRSIIAYPDLNSTLKGFIKFLTQQAY
jgi:hypothetical protein